MLRRVRDRYTCEGDARIAEDHMLFAGKRGALYRETHGKTKDCGKNWRYGAVPSGPSKCDEHTHAFFQGQKQERLERRNRGGEDLVGGLQTDGDRRSGSTFWLDWLNLLASGVQAVC